MNEFEGLSAEELIEKKDSIEREIKAQQEILEAVGKGLTIINSPFSHNFHDSSSSLSISRVIVTLSFSPSNVVWVCVVL